MHIAFLSSIHCNKAFLVGVRTMPSSPKIIVLKSREIMYTLILVFLAVLLVFFMILMFTGSKDSSLSAIQITEDIHTSRFTPGIYTSAVSLGGNAVNIEVSVDKNRINHIHLTNLNTSITTSFPLITPAFEHLSEQILTTQSLEHITCSPENRYTSQLLFSAIEKALKLAVIAQPN